MGPSSGVSPWWGYSATYLAVLVALFGPQFWAWKRRPKLRVELVSSAGDFEVETIGGRRQDTRYYRLRAVNKRQASFVQDVHIVVDQVEVSLLASDQPRLEYQGPLPLVWQHAGAFPPFRSVGTAAVADFLVVTEKRILKLMTAITPKKYLSADPEQGAWVYAGRTRLWITVAARGRESDSPPVRFEINWDGQWERGEREMENHLCIRVR